MSNFLEQSQIAAQQGDWAKLSQSLQHLLTEASIPLPQHELEQVLALALVVLEAGDFQDRWDIAKLLRSLGNPAIAPLLDLLQDEEANLESRWFAARILGELENPAAIQALITVLQNTEDDELSAMAADALANVGTAAIASLTPLLAEDDTRLLAVQALSRIRHSATIPSLLSVVNDSQPAVRAMAIEALGSFHDRRVPPVLLQVLDDRAAVVRRAAIASLAVRPDLAAELDLVHRFVQHLSDFNLNVCLQAANALGRLGTDAAASALFHLLNTLTTPVPLQLEAVRALGWANSETALTYLEQSLSSEKFSPVDQEIIAVLGRWTAPELKPRAAQTLISLLNTGYSSRFDAASKQAIALALGHLGQSEAIAPLTQLLADEDRSVQLHAIAALKTLDSQASLHYLEDLSNRKDLSIAMQQGIAIALQEWNQSTSGGR